MAVKSTFSIGTSLEDLDREIVDRVATAMVKANRSDDIHPASHNQFRERLVLHRAEHGRSPGIVVGASRPSLPAWRNKPHLTSCARRAARAKSQR